MGLKYHAHGWCEINLEELLTLVWSFEISQQHTSVIEKTKSIRWNSNGSRKQIRLVVISEPKYANKQMAKHHIRVFVQLIKRSPTHVKNVIIFQMSSDQNQHYKWHNKMTPVQMTNFCFLSMNTTLTLYNQYKLSVLINFISKLLVKQEHSMRINKQSKQD